MSDNQLTELEELIRLCSATRDEVRINGLADLDDFNQQFDDVFTRLGEVGETDLTGGDQTSFRHRLKDLERVRQQLAGELVELRLQMAQRLTGVSRGRRGLKGYRDALSGLTRGARRGRG